MCVHVHKHVSAREQAFQAEGMTNWRHKAHVAVDRAVGPMIRLEGGTARMAVEHEEGKRQDWDCDQKEPSKWAWAGMDLLVNQGLQPSPCFLPHDRAGQGSVSVSGRSGLRRAGRPSTVG